MFDIINASNGGTAKRNALVKSVSAFAIALLFAGAPAALAADNGINRLVTVQQMKADTAGAEELQAKEGQAEESQMAEQAESSEAMVIPPTNEEMQQQKLGYRSGKAQVQELQRKQ